MFFIAKRKRKGMRALRLYQWRKRRAGDRRSVNTPGEIGERCASKIRLENLSGVVVLLININLLIFPPY